jgi:ATP phosphoribosyltransferase
MVTPWWKKGDNSRAKIFLSFGATEAKPPEDSDCIMDVTETGSTIEANNLRILETVFKSSAVLIANKKSLDDPEKREKIYDIVALLKEVGLATGFHVEEDTAEALLAVLRLAVARYQDRSMWEQLVKAGMNTDVSWARSAGAYDRLFGALVRDRSIG